MRQRARIFIDYWNFQLNWNERAGDARCDWLVLPSVLIHAAGIDLDHRAIDYEGTHLYAGVDPSNDNLLKWLESFLDRQPGYTVRVSRQARRNRPHRCTACGTEVESCPSCGEMHSSTVTKGLVAQMIVDMLTLCSDGGCDVPIVVSSDTEIAPAVQHLRARGVKVFHAGWRDSSIELAREAWASIELDRIMSEMVRQR